MGGPGRVCSLLVALLAWGTPFSALAAPRIMEIQPRPAGGGEWIEILNPTDRAINLGGWLLWDATGRRRELPQGLVLDSGARLVLADKPDSLRAWFALTDTIHVVRPSGWPVLNDSDKDNGPADSIVLADAAGSVVDSMAYFAAWLPPARGRSLERVGAMSPAVEATSWGWSGDSRGATPGVRNSLEGESQGDRGEVFTGPDRVAPGRISAVFRYRVPGPGTLALWLLDPDGRRVALLRPPGPAPAVGSFVWGAATPGPSTAGVYLLCLLWQGGADQVRRCRSLWVTP